jgi:hypothetical protein
MPHAAPTLAAIRADEALTVPDFLSRTGLGQKSLRKAKAQGLPVRRIGRRCYIIGRDWLDYLARQGK